MATLDDFSLRTKPQYWTAAVWKKVPGRGLIWQGYSPVRYESWSKFLDRRQALGLDYQTRSYYWDGSRWVLDHSTVIGGEAGKLERRNPLPPGRYWQDIFAAQASAWNAWLSENVASGAVRVAKVEHFKPDPLRSGEWLPDAFQPENAGTIPARTWVLFDVVTATPWPAVKLGFPTIADSSVQTSSDTATNPPGPSPREELADAAMAIVKPVAYLAGGLLMLKLLLDRK